MTNESQDKTTAWVISIFIHTLLLVALYFIMFRTPNPPLGSGSGVVLNLGFVDEGTGEVQTYNQPNESTLNEENKNIETTETQPTESQEPTPEENLSQEDGKLLTSEEESEVKTESTPKEPTLEENKSKVEPKSEPKKEEKQKEEKVNTKALFGGQGGKSTSGGNNNGDKPNSIGDQGNPNGNKDAKALYGNMGEGGDGSGGSGGGASLDLAGWKWDKKPKVNDDNEDENGKIVFEITIDDQGDIITIKTLEKTVSPAVEKLYRAEVEKLSFTKSDNKLPASKSTGRITFIIRAR